MLTDPDSLDKPFEYTESDTELPVDAPAEVSTIGGGDLSLYLNAQLTAQSRLLVFQYSLQHSLTKKAFTELLQLLPVHLPTKAAIPSSVYGLKQEFIEAFPEAVAEQHHYCSSQNCQGGSSGGAAAVFITIPLRPQLKRIMEFICYLFQYVLRL